MKLTRRFGSLGRMGSLACTLGIVVGCGEEAASVDPAARVQTEADAKNAMLTTSNKKSSGVTPRQNTRNAMGTGARQQKQQKPK
jgi:hypothetical protein